VDVWTDTGVDRRDISGVGCTEADEKNIVKTIKEEIAVQKKANMETKGV